MTTFNEEKEFEERSDYIESSDLELWNVENEHFNFIQQKLLGYGAKLLAGPRGTGKTHQMKIVHAKCVGDIKKPASVFVSFSKYYHLEPLLTKVPNAMQIFHTWVLCKILLGCDSASRDFVSSFSVFSDELTEFSVSEFVSKAEKLKATQLGDDPLITKVTIAKIVAILENFAKCLNRNRIVLMMDDAALSLTPEYLIEFFDIFRSLKTKMISPKASVYPGTTQYGPRFHVGQDAEMIQCWLSVETPTYSDFMDTLIKKRFEAYTVGINKEVIELFKFASFGVPRAFISLLRSYGARTDKNVLSKFNNVIDQQAKIIETEYLSISQKLVQYNGVIYAGNKLFKKIIDEIFEDNKNLVNQKNIIIGISSDSISNYKLADRMIRFLIEAGLLYEDVPVKHGANKGTGERREYNRYIPHLIFLLQNRTFAKGTTNSFQEMLKSISMPSRKHPVRRGLGNLLKGEQLGSLKLDLPPCQECKTPRISVEQRFCHNCGKELVNQSAYEKCMKLSVEDLPLTKWQIERVKEIQLLTIGDIVALQDPGTELRKIHRVGVKISEKIYKEVIKTVDEFLA